MGLLHIVCADYDAILHLRCNLSHAEVLSPTALRVLYNNLRQERHLETAFKVDITDKQKP